MARAMVNKAQVKMIRSIVHGRLGWDNDQYHQWLSDLGGPPSTLDLGRAEAANLIDLLLDLAEGRSPRVWRLDGATVLQRRQITDLAAQAGLADTSGIIHRATYGRADRVGQCSIHQARSVTEALKAVIKRQATAACHGA